MSSRRAARVREPIQAKKKPRGARKALSQARRKGNKCGVAKKMSVMVWGGIGYERME